MSKAVYGNLPAQYRVLEYIESNGTQYIDTGTKATQDTRVVVDHHLYSSGGDASIFGAWNGFASNGFIYVVLSGTTSGYWCYANGTVGISMTATGRHVVEADGNVLKLDGSTIATASAADFTGSYNMYLCAHNEAGTASNLAAVRIHACQMYDGDAMVRDFVPVSGPEGVGLYDRVQGRFYGNAGSGDFSAGAATGAIIDVGSQTRKAKKLYTVLGGLTRKVKKGYAVIGGATRLFFSAGVSVVYTGTHTVEDATMDGEEYVLYTLTGSGTLTLDGADGNVRYWMCGGGAAGAAGFTYSSTYYGGAGGAGGFVADGVLASGQYAVVIGAGGSNNASGGATDIGGITANGGMAETGRGSTSTVYGGSGGGSEIYVLKGAGVSTYPFGMTSLSAHSAGGGSGASKVAYKGGNGGTNGGNGTVTEYRDWSYAMGGSGGEKGGGQGGGLGSSKDTPQVGSAATFYGSGGGGGAANSGAKTKTAAGAAGYQGVAYILIPKEAMA